MLNFDKETSAGKLVKDIEKLLFRAIWLVKVNFQDDSIRSSIIGKDRVCTNITFLLLEIITWWQNLGLRVSLGLHFIFICKCKTQKEIKFKLR